MPELEFKQKIEFNVDQTTIDRVEALAVISGLDIDAWFRRLVDDWIAQGSRHMRIDHVEIKEVRKPVFDIIKWIADMVHPLRTKARAALDSGLSFIGAKKPKEEVIELAEEVVIEEAPVEVEAKPTEEPIEEVDEEAEKKKAVQKALLEEQERIKAALAELEKT